MVRLGQGAGCRWLLAGLLGAGACGGPAGREDIVAEAGSWILEPSRMATWLERIPAGHPTRQDAERAALVWVDYALLAQAVASGRPLTDSATVATAVEPDRLLLILRNWHDTLVARRPRLPAQLVDSLFAGDIVRLFQHILIRHPEGTDAPALQQVRRRADSILAAARSGIDFGSLARRSSEDPTASDDGFLPVARRGMLWPELEGAAWNLEPGGVIGVSSRVGLHVVRRPGPDQARVRIQAWAESTATRRADSVHADSVRTARRFRTSDRAVHLLQAFFDDPTVRADTSSPLATWEGGWLPLREAILWIDLLPPGPYLMLRDGSDLALRGFIRDISLQRMLLDEATAAGLRVTPAQSAELQEAYQRGLREALALIGLGDTATVGPSEAAGRVAALLDAMAADRVRWRPLPSGLGALLREESGYRLHPAGIARSVDAAQSVR